MTIKNLILTMLRITRLIAAADQIRFLYSYLKYFQQNFKFNTNPATPNPRSPIPARLLYEVFGEVDYYNFFRSGKKSSESIISIVERYVSLDSATIYELGCGVGRVLDYMPEMLSGKQCRFIGSDINKKMIDWCRLNIGQVEFFVNKIEPPLIIAGDSVDVAYSLSVFTHLSERLQAKWLQEVIRILKPGGIFLFTVHGDYYARKKLTRQELTRYDSGAIIVRKASEGSRSLTTFQSPEYMQRDLLANLEIVDHIYDPLLEIAGSQDVWIIRK